MKRMTLFLVSFFLILAFTTSCSDQPSPTEPIGDIEPSLSLFDDPGTDRISQLIEALYPKPILYLGARVRWHAIQWNVYRGRIRAAQRQVRVFADLAVFYASWGMLLDPDPGDDDPGLPDTTEEAVSELITRLFVFAGLSGSDAQQEHPDFFDEVYGDGETAVGVIEPGAEEETVIVTENAYAAVVAPEGAVEEGEAPVFVAINQQSQATCEQGNDLAKANGCWNITRSPAGEFAKKVAVEICVADNPDLTDGQWAALRVHQRDGQTITALPWVEDQGVLDCEGFVQTASLDIAPTMLASLGNHVADFLLPEPLGASLWGRPSTRLGGLTGSFSDFFGAVPEATQELPIECGSPSGGDFYYRGFYIPSYPGTSLSEVKMYFAERGEGGTREVSLTVREDTYDGETLGTAFLSVDPADNPEFGQVSVYTDAVFEFESIGIPQGSLVTFELTITGEYTEPFYYGLSSDGACPIEQTNYTNPPLDTPRWNKPAIRISDLILY
jgi:hypothetical protein